MFLSSFYCFLERGLTTNHTTCLASLTVKYSALTDFSLKFLEYFLTFIGACNAVSCSSDMPETTFKIFLNVSISVFDLTSFHTSREPVFYVQNE